MSTKRRVSSFAGVIAAKRRKQPGKYRKKQPMVKKNPNFASPSYAYFPGVGWPDNLVVRTRYVDTQKLTSTSGSINYYQYRLNGLYDPDFTGAGSQPSWYDDLLTSAGPYYKYQVLSCYYEVQLMGTGSTDVPVKVVICPANATLSGKTIEEIAEMPDSTQRLTNFNSADCIIRGTIDQRKFSGYNDVGDLSANYNASPAFVSLICVAGQTYDTSTTSSVIFQIRLTYTAKLFSTQPVTQS